ncbi:NAD(P) transhydrogenase subunit alpha [Salinimonas lutimaris]|uniref:NAD(P) transhydrogenase subunit alpha n=1 Tax=Salinimonas lutimaris TaxID=914153 RepID=UPI0010BFF91E|nr:NAD(P) transhydrogenase subunit alpha [Salinimonas lutimaris]
MKVLVLNEGSGQQNHAEKRCAVSQDSVKRMVKRGITVRIEQGAGILAGYSDKIFTEAGAQIVETPGLVLADTDALLCVNRPAPEVFLKLKPRSLVVGYIDPFFQKALVEELAKHQLTTISMEMIPRSSRAQKMDALSSQASLAGYVMVMLAATHFPGILPMMMTPSGTIKPAKVFIIGAGVAGLQAIATARRLGASVLAYDTRAVVAEQVESLGARFLKIDLGETGQTKDGYAQALSDTQKQQQQAAQQDAIADADIVITTAQLFGRKPPVLISKDTLALMRTGSVVVDMAALSGGNVEGSEPGKVVQINGVTVIGTGHWSQAVARDATDMYASNLFNLIDEFYDEQGQKVLLPSDDEILKASMITKDGAITDQMLVNAYQEAQ